MNKRLFRSRSDRMIGGVCGGLAQFFGLDSSAVRIAMVFLTIFAGMSILVYLIMWVIIPEE
ncbi:MAG: PspC domain-containing protein [Alistipes sp.]|nr:PspC domain-containing protein [Alistipes sp.]